MTKSTAALRARPDWNTGLLWFIFAVIAGGFVFQDGIDALLAAWALPEYSHGPLIPLLSGLLFLRQLKDYPPDTGPKTGRWTGLPFIALALLMSAAGRPGDIPEMPAYATIFWIWGVLLISFGWPTGRHFWPPVVHLIYMLPLPGILQVKLTTNLQMISSELGAYFLELLQVPVFLSGNIIDLGVIQLHVAEACSGLRYLFPILSFSYIFAVLYRGPMWHKAVLLISAAPITVLMNSVRIALAGVIAQHNPDWLDGFTHFFEGWVIFIICIVMLFLLAWLMLRLRPRAHRLPLAEALDLETDGLWDQAKRITLIQPSTALITAGVLSAATALGLATLPERGVVQVDRDPFTLFPREIGQWQQVGGHRPLTDRVEAVLMADDYRSVSFARGAGEPQVDLFISWYDNQIDGGVHSPEVCLPSSGWEIAWIERVNIAEVMGTEADFNLNRAIIQQGETRMMVYYWFQQGERRVAWDMAMKVYLMIDAVRTGYTGGGMVRLITRIGPEESDAQAEARLQDMLGDMMPVLPRFIPPEPARF